MDAAGLRAGYREHNSKRIDTAGLRAGYREHKENRYSWCKSWIQRTQGEYIQLV